MSDLQERIESLRHKTCNRGTDDIDYMSDMDNWLCVHVTRYPPKRNSEGEMYIETTAMATGYELPRASVHVTLNQVVSSNSGGNWDDAPIVVLAPYNGVVSKNGSPQEVSVDDTYFIPNPDTGLVLPKDAYVIQPDNESGKLFEIGKHGATYKTDGYTDEEVEEILSLNPWNREDYEKYKSGDIDEEVAKDVLLRDERLIKAYEISKDKKAFMRGIFEEERFTILNKLLRDAVIKMSMEETGHRYVLAHEDDISGRVADVASKSGVRGNSGDKGHSCSLEHELEECGCKLYSLSETLKSKDANAIYDLLSKSKDPLYKGVITSILSDQKIPDVYQAYVGVCAEYVDHMKHSAEWQYNQEASKKLLKEAERLEKGGIKGYNPHLDVVLHRNADRLTEDINQSLEELKKDPDTYAKLKIGLERTQDVPSAIFLHGRGGRL